jgi:hypothetical protein
LHGEVVAVDHRDVVEVLFFKKREYINILVSTSTNAYDCSLLRASVAQSKESQKRSFEPSRRQFSNGKTKEQFHC